jgi:hypothetical protein
MSEPTAQSVNAPGIPQHMVYRARLMGLVPGEQFQYRVLRTGEPVFIATGRARKSAEQPYRLVLFGDCAQGTPASRAIAYQASLANPDFIFIPGDIIYDSGRISEYRQKFFPVYNAETPSPDTGAPLLRSTLFIAAPGNHDIALTNFQRYADALAYFLYWDQPLNGSYTDREPGSAARVSGGIRAALPADGEFLLRLRQCALDRPRFQPVHGMEQSGTALLGGERSGSGAQRHLALRGLPPSRLQFRH